MAYARRAAAVALSLSTIGLRADATPAPLAEIVGATTIEISRHDATRIYDVPVSVEVHSKDPSKVSFSLRDVTLAGLRHPEADGSVRAERCPTEPIRLCMTVDARLLATPGTYVAHVLAAGPNEEGAASTKQLEVSVVVPAATLQIGSPIQLEVIYPVPCPWGDAFCPKGQPRPHTVLVAETSAKAPLSMLTANSTGLRAGGDAMGPTPLIARLDGDIGAFGRGALSFELPERVPLGTSTGTVLVSARELASPVSATVNVRARVHHVWLILAALAGVLAGYFGRRRLQDRRDRNEALLEVHRVLAALTETRARIDAKEILDRIDDTARALRAALDAPEGVPRLRVLVAEARTAIERAEKDFSTRRERLAAELSSTRTQLGAQHHHPAPVRAGLAEAHALLDQLETRLAQGHLDEVGAALEKPVKEALARVQDAAVAWLTSLAAQATAAPRDVADLAPELEGLGTEARERLKMQDSLQELLRGERVLAARAQQVLEEVTLRVRDRIARWVTAAERSSEDDAVLQPLRTQRDELLSWLGQRRSATDLADLLRRADELRASASAIGKPERSLGAARATPQPSSAPPLVVEIAAPLRPVEGEPCELSLRATPELPAGAEVSWMVGGGRQPGASGTGALQFRPTAAGPVDVVVDVSLGGKSVAQASTRLQVRAAEGSAAIAPQLRAIERDDRLLTLVSAAVAPLLGYLLFKDQFLGTAADFVPVVLWGFFLDIGVAKVGEMARSSSPLPAPKAGGTSSAPS